jgi:hypothetical protein
MPNEIDDDSDEPGKNQSKRNIPPSLDYQQRGSEKYQPRTPLGIQVLAGFIAWIAGLLFVFEAAKDRAWGSPFMDSQNAFYCAIAAALVGVGALTIWLRLRFRWRGFLPGLLLGFGLSCLVPVGIILIICGVGRH